MALKLQCVKSEVPPHFFNRDEVEALLDGPARQSHISDERHRYVEGLVESIQLQSPERDASNTDSCVYKLQIKRSEMDVRLEWRDGEEVWPGVMNLVQALEEIYFSLFSKNPGNGATKDL